MTNDQSERLLQKGRALFARREEAARKLAAIDRKIDEARKSYSAAIGCRVPIRVESFQREATAERKAVNNG